MNLKHAVSVGIGLFIAFIGLQNAKIVVNNDSTLVSVFSFKSSVSGGTFNTEGITVLLALIGLLITAILLVKSVKGNILWGILITWGLGIICQLTGLYKPDPAAGWFSLLPDFSNGISIPSMAPTFMKMDFSIVFTLDFVVIMFAFLFVDMFDTHSTYCSSYCIRKKSTFKKFPAPASRSDHLGYRFCGSKRRNEIRRRLYF